MVSYKARQELYSQLTDWPKRALVTCMPEDDDKERYIEITMCSAATMPVSDTEMSYMPIINLTTSQAIRLAHFILDNLTEDDFKDYGEER